MDRAERASIGERGREREREEFVDFLQLFSWWSVAGGGDAMAQSVSGRVTGKSKQGPRKINVVAKLCTKLCAIDKSDKFLQAVTIS